MGKSTIIESGLTCFVRAKAELMKSWLDDDFAGELVREKIRALTLEPGSADDGALTGMAARKEYSFPGFSVSVQVLNEEFLEAVFDRLTEGYEDESVREKLSYVQQFCLQPAFEMDHQTVHVDCTGFLVYAVIKNDKCLKELQDYMERERDVCYEAYLSSPYRDTPFLQWFPAPLVTDACLCLGLLERIRRGDEGAYSAYMKIAAEGYKKMRSELKHCQAVDGALLRVLSQEEDVGLRLSVLTLGLAMAQDMEIPVKEDYTFYNILSGLVHYEEEMFEPAEEAKITEEGKRRQRQLESVYNCQDFHRCYVESIFHSPPPDLGPEEHGLLHDSDYERIFAAFHVNPRIFQGIRLSREEVQKICSSDEEITWEDYEPMLLIATLCKYITVLSHGYSQERKTRAWDEAKLLREELLNSKKLLLSTKEQLSKAKSENSKMAANIDECRQALSRKKEQLAGVRNQQETIKKELEELRRFVAATLEKPESISDEGIAGAPDRNSGGLRALDRQKSLRSLYGQQVVVVGGHENWQRRVRTQFPHWQYLPADKNHFDSRTIQNKNIIIVNTLVLKHSCYYRLMAQRRPEQMVLYVNENNMDRFLEQLGRQLGAVPMEA